MRHINSCYFCITPYQIISAVSIARQNHETADLYVLFDGAENYINEIRKENIFSKVVFIRKNRKKSTHRISRWLNDLREYIQCSKIAQEILIPNTIYDNLYFPCRILEIRCCFFYYIKKNIPIQRISFDDGAGSYINDSINYIKPADAIVRRLFFGKKALEPVTVKMLFDPNLYKLTCKSPKYTIKKINGEFDKQETTELFNRIFQFKKSDLITEDCILLGCIRDEILDKQGQKKLELIYNKIFQACGADNIIVKPHPRNTASLKDGIKYYTNYKLPLECLYMNLNCNDKVLISVSSTAAVTPKIFFDQEPYILLLYKLLDLKKPNMNQADLDTYYANCKKLYTHPERFMIPENEEELAVCLGLIRTFLHSKGQNNEV